MRMIVLALAAVSIAAPAQAQPPTTRAMKDVYAGGFQDCTAAMEKLVKFVHEDDATYAHLGLWSAEKANAGMATVVTSQQFEDGHGIATLSAVKSATGCDVSVTQVLTAPEQTCQSLRTTVFKDWKEYSDFNHTKMYQDPTTSNAKVVLVPLAQTGCVMVKTIVGYGL